MLIRNLTHIYSCPYSYVMDRLIRNRYHELMMFVLYLCLHLTTSLLIPTQSHADPILKVKLDSTIIQRFKRVQVNVPIDPFYRRGSLIAEGVSLDELLDAQLSDHIKAHPERYLLRFVCSDGYMTTYPFSSIIGGTGIVADRLISLAPQKDTPASEQPRTATQPWPMRQKGKKRDHPGPYYLLWEGERYSKHRPWPYQLTSIDILPANHLAALKPNPGDGVEAGYQLFMTHCKACHTLNLVGGTMGPELNVPQNILNYRDRAQLLAFIKNPSSFRFSSLMPPSTLSIKEINSVLDYLSAMSNRQVCQSIDACRRLVQR